MVHALLNLLLPQGEHMDNILARRWQTKVLGEGKWELPMLKVLSRRQPVVAEHQDEGRRQLTYLY